MGMVEGSVTLAIQPVSVAKQRVGVPGSSSLSGSTSTCSLFACKQLGKWGSKMSRRYPRHLALSQKIYVKDLYKIYREDFTRISTRSSHKDLYKTLVKIFIWYYGPLRLHHGLDLVIERHSRELIRSLYHALPGSKGSVKISTAPQWERSDTHKVTRRSREPCQNSHRATTTRAIRRAPSAEGCVSTC